ncbi:Delta-aminolevulinic acid dehydratase [Diplonema papillatum]|nr:Delta-aminolevulinic acid dehydratase [Diplonema papillatum]
MYPALRLRRLRMKASLRALFQETRLSKDDLVQAVSDGDTAVVDRALEAGLHGLYVAPRCLADAAERVKELRAAAGAATALFVSIDAGFNEEASLMDSVLQIASAGGDVVLLDVPNHRLNALREMLEGEGFIHTVLAAKAAKGAESHVPDSADALFADGGLCELDLLADLCGSTVAPVIAVQPAAEVNQLSAAFDREWLDSSKVVPETLLSLKRAGASAIVSPFAVQVLAHI